MRYSQTLLIPTLIPTQGLSTEKYRCYINIFYYYFIIIYFIIIIVIFIFIINTEGAIESVHINGVSVLKF